MSALDAEAVYRDSLQTYRSDGWTLYGLAEALDAQKNTGEWARVREVFARAWSLADLKLAASRLWPPPEPLEQHGPFVTRHSCAMNSQIATVARFLS